MPFRPRKKKSRQTKFHRCSWCGAQVRRRAARCNDAPSAEAQVQIRPGAARAAARGLDEARSSIRGAVRGESGLLRPVDDADLHIGFDVDLAGKPDIRGQVAFAIEPFLLGRPMGGTLPSSTSTRQVVHRALPPQRWRMSMPASSIARTSFFPASTFNRFLPVDRHGGHRLWISRIEDGRGSPGRRWSGAPPGRIRPDRDGTHAPNGADLRPLATYSHGEFRVSAAGRAVKRPTWTVRASPAAGGRR